MTTTHTHLLRVVTPLHLGDGSSVGSVDLPVARERHTDWPWLPGASIKGALRARASFMERPAAEIVRVFGAERGTDLQKGALAVSPGCLLALAARSLKNTWVLVASPLSLGRLARELTDPPPIPRPASTERVLAANPGDLKAHENTQGQLIAVIEDLCWLLDEDQHVGEWAGLLASFDPLCQVDEAQVPRLVVVHDEVFQHAARAWTWTRTRNKLNKRGVVEDHHLFTTEYVPPESLFWCTTTWPDEDAAFAAGDILPGDAETWWLAGHQSTGAGRVTWYRRAT